MVRSFPNQTRTNASASTVFPAFAGVAARINDSKNARRRSGCYNPFSRGLGTRHWQASSLIVVFLAEEHAIALAANHGAEVASRIWFLRIKEEAALGG